MCIWLDFGKWVEPRTFPHPLVYIITHVHIIIKKKKSVHSERISNNNYLKIHFNISMANWVYMHTI